MGARGMRLAVVSVVLAFVLALALGAIGAGGTAYAAGSTLSVLSGEVLVSHDGGAFVAAVDGEPLHEGDTIRTTDGRAVVTFFEGSTVTIEPGTQLAVDTAATAADGGTIIRMTQAIGRTWNVVTKLVTGLSRYEIRTPATTASVRGTEFEVAADAETTTVDTTEGLVVQRVADGAGGVVDVPVRAGMTQTQRRHAPPAPATPRAAPERVVSVRVPAASAMVVDQFGRANGVRRDGRVVAETPGAQVRRVDGALVVRLPNVDDGSLATRVAKTDGDREVPVTTTVTEHGRSVSSVAPTARDSRPVPHLAPRAGSHRPLEGAAAHSGDGGQAPREETARDRRLTRP